MEFFKYSQSTNAEKNGDFFARSGKADQENRIPEKNRMINSFFEILVKKHDSACKE